MSTRRGGIESAFASRLAHALRPFRHVVPVRSVRRRKIERPKVPEAAAEPLAVLEVERES